MRTLTKLGFGECLLVRREYATMDLVTRTPSPPKTKCPKCNYQYHLLSDSDNEEDELTPSCPKCRRAFQSDRYDEQHIEDALNESLGSINSDDAVKIVERAIVKGVCPACAVDLPSDASPYKPNPGDFCYIGTQCICPICSTIYEDPSNRNSKYNKQASKTALIKARRNRLLYNNNLSNDSDDDTDPGNLTRKKVGQKPVNRKKSNKMTKRENKTVATTTYGNSPASNTRQAERNAKAETALSLKRVMTQIQTLHDKVDTFGLTSDLEEKLLALQAEETTLRLQDELSARAAAATASSKPTTKASMEGPRVKSRGVEAEHNSLPDDDPMPDMYRFASTCATKRIKQNRESRSKEDPTQEE
jgi:hypothetical protein